MIKWCKCRAHAVEHLLTETGECIPCMEHGVRDGSERYGLARQVDVSSGGDNSCDPSGPCGLGDDRPRIPTEVGDKVEGQCPRTRRPS